MAYQSIKPRQLAPTVGQDGSEASIWADSANGVIGDNIAVGRVLYNGNVGIVPDDETWMPARENITSCNIVPVGDIHLFIGFTGSPPREQRPGSPSSPALPASKAEIMAEDRSEPALPV